MKKLFILLTITIFCSCSSEVKLSFKNGSSENYRKVVAQIGKNKYKFENLESGKKTKPIKVKGTYPYCPVSIITEKDTLDFRPIDYVGEKYYKSGRLNMVLIIIERENQRILDIILKR